MERIYEAGRKDFEDGAAREPKIAELDSNDDEPDADLEDNGDNEGYGGHADTASAVRARWHSIIR